MEKIRVIYGTDLDKFSEKLWDSSRGHLAVSLIYHTECMQLKLGNTSMETGGVTSRALITATDPFASSDYGGFSPRELESPITIKHRAHGSAQISLHCGIASRV